MLKDASHGLTKTLSQSLEKRQTQQIKDTRWCGTKIVKNPCDRSSARHRPTRRRQLPSQIFQGEFFNVLGDKSTNRFNSMQLGDASVPQNVDSLHCPVWFIEQSGVQSINLRNGWHAHSHVFHEPIATAMTEVGIEHLRALARAAVWFPATPERVCELECWHELIIQGISLCEDKNKGEGNWLDMSHTPQTTWAPKFTNHVVSKDDKPRGQRCSQTMWLVKFGDYVVSDVHKPCG